MKSQLQSKSDQILQAFSAVPPSYASAPTASSSTSSSTSSSHTASSTSSSSSSSVSRPAVEPGTCLERSLTVPEITHRLQRLGVVLNREDEERLLLEVNRQLEHPHPHNNKRGGGGERGGERDSDNGVGDVGVDIDTFCGVLGLGVISDARNKIGDSYLYLQQLSFCLLVLVAVLNVCFVSWLRLYLYCICI